ncbi:MAG: hypothetical protein ACTHMU_05810, partial [Thermomicrobiales bacterium]
VRGHTLANHKQNNTYDKWDWAHWEEYLTELAAWGSNLAVLYPLHPARWPDVLPFVAPRWFASPMHEAEWQRQWAIQRRLPALCHELGLRYGVWLPVNDIFPEEVRRQPALTRHGGPYVCPHIPAARERIRALRDTLFAALPHIDVLVLPSRDDGGCPGWSDCTPWVDTYLALAQEQAAQMRQRHPECTVLLGLQGLLPAEAQTVLDWLDRDRPAWVEGIEIGPYSELMTYGRPDAPGGVLAQEPYGRGGPRSAPVHRLRAALPGQYRLVLYPDTTHTYRSQNPVVSMDPAAQLVWDRENGPLPRPREVAAIHAATAPASDGGAPYSEGNTDDLNKFVWSALDWQPARAPAAVVADYARWFFGPAVAPAATDLLLRYEAVLNGPLLGNDDVGRCRALLDDCERAAPALLENWRWLLLRLGLLMLDQIQQVQARDRALVAALRYRVPSGVNSDPAPLLRQGIHYLERRFAETDGLLREIVWTRDALFARQRLAVRGVAALQNSYLQLDLVLEAWRELVARLDRGELAAYDERRAVLGVALRACEERLRAATQGVGLVAPLQEFAWEQGAPTW